jgi:hypothetical protein
MVGKRFVPHPSARKTLLLPRNLRLHGFAEPEEAMTEFAEFTLAAVQATSAPPQPGGFDRKGVRADRASCGAQRHHRALR